MGFLDKLTGKGKEASQSAQAKAGELKDKVGDLAADHNEDIDKAVDKVADLADKVTKGKFTDKIDEAAAKLKDAADKIDDDETPKSS